MAERSAHNRQVTGSSPVVSISSICCLSVLWTEKTVEHISADTTAPVDKQPNYLSGNPVTGNFATFEIGSNVKNIRFSDVAVRLNKEKYPNSYFMTVGPKSQYVEEKHLELFDPYVSCAAENIRYKDVRINGQIAEDLEKDIKIVEFGKLYPSSLPFGKGKAVCIRREK